MNVQEFVKQKIENLPDNKISQLKRMTSPSSNIEVFVWMLNGLDESYIENMEQSEEPTALEWSVFIPLHLYSIYPHYSDKGVSFAKALAMTAKDDEEAVSLSNRLKNIAMTRNMDANLRGFQDLARRLRNHRIPVNYPDLAFDLLMFQNDEYRNNIIKKWGTEFSTGL